MRTAIFINCCCSTEASCLLIPKFLSAFEEPAAARKSEFKPFVLYGSNYFEKGELFIEWKRNYFANMLFMQKNFKENFFQNVVSERKTSFQNKE